VQNETVNVGSIDYSGEGKILPNNTMTLNPKFKNQPLYALFIVELTPLYFMNLSNSLVNIGEYPVPIHQGRSPPFTIEFKVSNDAPAGDHNVYADLFYKNKDKWQLDRQIMPLHVRYWYENEWIQFLVIIASLALLIDFIGGKKYLKVLILGIFKILDLTKILTKIENILKRWIYGPKLLPWIANVKKWYLNIVN
jgi:hypothetical protein